MVLLLDKLMYKKIAVGKSVKLLTCVVLLALSVQLPVQAQQRNSVAVQDQIARVEEINEFKDLIVIGNRNIIFDRERIRVFYRGEAVNKRMLIPGLRVRFSVDNEGYLSVVNLLSPSNIIEHMLTD